MRGIARSFRNTFSKRGVAFGRKRHVLRDNAPVAFICGLQRRFTTRGLGAGFLGTAARFGMRGHSFRATRFRLLQSLTRGGEGCFRFGNMLRGGLFFRIGHSARKGRFVIRTQRCMGFARTTEPRFRCGQFGFGSLQLRRPGGGGFSGLVGSAFCLTHCFARFHQRGGGGITPRG
jgi:hypothetical protein